MHTRTRPAARQIGTSVRGVLGCLPKAKIWMGPCRAWTWRGIITCLAFLVLSVYAFEDVEDVESTPRAPDLDSTGEESRRSAALARWRNVVAIKARYHMNSSAFTVGAGGQGSANWEARGGGTEDKLANGIDHQPTAAQNLQVSAEQEGTKTYNNAEGVAFDLIIDQPEPGVHMFVHDPDSDSSGVFSLNIGFRIANPRTGAGYGWGAGYCCTHMTLRMSLVMEEAISDPVRWEWTAGPLEVCTNAYTSTWMPNIQDSWEWGSGRNVFLLQLFEAEPRCAGAVRGGCLLAANSSTFHMHLTSDFNYNAVHALRGPRELFRAVSPVIEGVLTESRALIPTTDIQGSHQQFANQLRIIEKKGLWSHPTDATQRRLAVYVLCDNAGNQESLAGFDEIAALFPGPDGSHLEVEVKRFPVTVPLARWAGRPQQDVDFEAEEAYRSDYVSFQQAWRHFASSSSNDEDWAVFMRADVQLHPAVRRNGSLGIPGFIRNILSDLFHLASADSFGWLGLCGHVLQGSVRANNADKGVTRNLTSASTTFARTVGSFPLAFGMTKRLASSMHWWRLSGRDTNRAGGFWAAGFDLPDISQGECKGIWIPRKHSDRSPVDPHLPVTSNGDPSRHAIPSLKSLPKDKAKVAFCLVGHPRHFRFEPSRGLADTIKRNVIEAFAEEAYTFVFAMPVISGMQTNPDLYTKPMRADVLVDALEYVRAVKVQYVYDTCQNDSCSPRPLTCLGRDLSQQTWQMSRWKDCYHMIQDFEAKNEMFFDWVWKLRFDLYFNFPVPAMSSLHPHTVYTYPFPPDNGWTLIDIFFAVPRQYLATVFAAVDLVQCEDAAALTGEGGHCSTINQQGVWIHCLLAGLFAGYEIPFEGLSFHDVSCMKMDIECIESKWVYERLFHRHPSGFEPSSTLVYGSVT